MTTGPDKAVCHPCAPSCCCEDVLAAVLLHNQIPGLNRSPCDLDVRLNTPAAYRQHMAMVCRLYTPAADQQRMTMQFNDVCFGGAPHLAEVEKLFSVFPTMDLHFDVRPGAARLL